jgi:RNA polymerase sigma-70 factor (ECF subfamily)
MNYDRVRQDRKLVKRACRGDSKALSSLYRLYLNDVYGFIYARVGSQADAEDLAAQVFLKMLENLESYRQEGPFVGWLLGIARHTVLDFWRQRYRAQELPLEQFLERFAAEPPAATSSDAEKRPWVEHLLEALPDRYRQVLELRFLKGYSVRDTAQAMAISENYVKVLQHRALKKAREVGERWETESDERTRKFDRTERVLEPLRQSPQR